MYTFTLAYTYALSQTLIIDSHSINLTQTITRLLSLADTNSPIHTHPKHVKDIVTHMLTHTF